MNKKTKSIELFGEKLLLSERTAGDLIALFNYVKTAKEQSDFESALFQAIQILHDALKINYEVLPWYKFLKAKRLKKLLSLMNIMNNLSQKQIFSLAEEVLELDGLKPIVNSTDDGKKKEPSSQ